MFTRHTTPSASTFFAVLLAAGLLWPGGAAQAQVVNCTLSSGVATCVDQPYSMGIIFEANTGWNQGVAGNAAITVDGGTNTAIAAPARGDSGWRNAGIVVRTSNAAMREIALTVGTGTNAVRITEHSAVANTNHGIYIHQAATGAGDTSGTTVTLTSGVMIGTSTAPMRWTGVHALILGNDNAGVHTITSAATIFSTTFGLEMVNRSLGSDVVTNSGSITTAATGGGPGIQVSPGEGSEVDARSGSSTTTNAATGTITTSAANAHGIRVLATGVALYKVVNSGTITVSGAPAHGILVDGRRFKGTTGNGGFEIENTGTIRASGAGSFGIYVEATGNVMNTGTDPITITNSGGVTSANHAILLSSEQGAVTVTASGGTLMSTSGDGIAIQQRADANMTVTSGADITAGMHGIRVQAVPDLVDATTATTGDISITTTGGTIEAESAGRDGIYAEDHAAHTGSVMVTNAASITAGRYGINADRKGAGAVSVTNAGGTVLGKKQAGIYAANQAGDATDVTVRVTDGTVRSTGQSTPAIAAENRGTGDVTVTIEAPEGNAEAMPTLISQYNAGVYANLPAADNTGKIAVTQRGTIAARKGVYARVGRASAANEMPPMENDQPVPVIDVTWSGTFSHGMAGVTGGTTADVSQDDMGRYVADTAAGAVAIHQEVETEKTIRYGSPAGIEAQVMSWRDVIAEVAAGDAPAAVAADNAAQLMLVPAGATADDNGYVAAFRAALGNGDIDSSAVLTAVASTATSLDDVTDAEIVTYLQMDDNDTRTLLRNVLAQGLSDAEKAVLRAVVTNTGLDAALDDADAGFSMTYKDAVKALLERRNIGNIRVNMTGGSIASRGDGIRAYYATPNAMNGSIDVTVAAGATVMGGMAGIYVANAGAIDITVAEGASVTGGMAGIYVANAGAMGTGDNRILKQTVTVNGMVTGGTDAAVHLVGGGTLTVGEMGKLMAPTGSSGVAIKVNEPGRSVITINGEVTGNPGEGRAVVEIAGGGTLTIGEMGSVMAAEGADGGAVSASQGEVQLAIYASELNSKVDARNAVARLRGGISGIPQANVRVTDPAGQNLSVPIGDDGELNLGGSSDFLGLADCPAGQELQDGTCMPRMDDDEEEEQHPMLPTNCGLARDNCRLYAALPSTLLAMNGVPTYAERMSAARDAKGGWARVEVARGEWKADSWTMTQPDVDLAYDHSRSGVRAGMDFAMGDAGRVGVSVHGLRGSAEMAQVGEIDLSGAGVGVHGTAASAGGFHVDAQAAVTWYHADLKSTHPAIVAMIPGDTLKNDVNGHGYALGVEVGQALPMGGGLAVTPRAGLTWSKADLDDFTDEAGRQVSVKEAQSLKGRAGVGVEKALDGDGMDAGSRVFASLDVEQEFKEETEADVSGNSLKASARKTRIRAALGTAHVWGEGRYALQGSLGYTAGGGGNRDYGGGLSFGMRF